MKVNKAGQKVSTNYITKIRGPLATDLQRSAAGVKKNRWLPQTVYIGRRSRSKKEKDKKTFEIRMVSTLSSDRFFVHVTIDDSCRTT